MTRRRWIVFAALVGLGCRGSEDAGAKPGPADAASLAEAPAAPVDAAKREAGAAPATTESPTVDPAAAAPSEPAAVAPGLGSIPSFHLAVQVDPDSPREDYQVAPLRVFDSLDGSVFVAGGPLVVRVAAGGVIEPTPAAMKGIQPIMEASPDLSLYDLYFGWRTEYLGGRWPDALFLTTTWSSGSRGGDPITLHRWREDHWQIVDTKQGMLSYHIARVAPWQDEQILGLRRYTIEFGEDEVENEALERRTKPELARAKKLVVLRGPGQAPKQLATRSILDFDALADGTIVALVDDGGKDHEQQEVLHTQAGAITVRSLPPAPDEAYLSRIELVDPRHAWAWTEGSEPPALAVFDGDGWRLDTAPACAIGLSAFTVSPAGRQWASCGSPTAEGLEPGGDVWSRAPGQEWTKVALPKGAEIRRIVVAGEDDVWLAGDRRVYHSKPHEKVVTMPGMDRMWLDSLAYRDPVALDTDCLVLMIALLGPVDGDYASEQATLAQALAGIDDDDALEFGVGEFRGRKQLALTIGSWAENRKAIIAALRKHAAPLLGEAYCFYPENFETIELAKG